MPHNNGTPELTGRAAVGWGVVGHNGSWLYDNGSACGAECSYAFAWERCLLDVCVPIAGAIGRVYKVRSVDVGSRLRVVVTATKYDCGASGADCRWVTRAAASSQTSVVPKPQVKKKPKPRPRG